MIALGTPVHIQALARDAIEEYKSIKKLHLKDMHK